MGRNAIVRLCGSKQIALAIAAVLTTFSQFSIAAELKQLISGTNAPLTLKLKDLNSDWRGLTISGPNETGETILTRNNYYTKGETVTVGSETYMIAYHFQPTPGKITAEAALTLSLLNLRTIGSLNNIHEFNLEQEIKTLESRRMQSQYRIPSLSTPPSRPLNFRTSPPPVSLPPNFRLPTAPLPISPTPPPLIYRPPTNPKPLTIPSPSANPTPISPQ